MSNTSTEQIATQGSNLRIILKLQNEKNVTWADNVVDNENMKKKKSKNCCTFHKKKEVFKDRINPDLDLKQFMNLCEPNKNI